METFLLLRIFVWPVVVFTLLNSVPVQVFKRPFGYTMPLTFVSAAFILYFSQFIFMSFIPGFYVVEVLAIVGMAVLIIKKDQIDNFLSIGFIVFLTINILAFFFYYGRHLFDFDEFWHWGTMVKESLRLDRFYCVAESRLVIHKDYPPFQCMVEVLWSMLAGTYREDAVTIGLHVFCASVLFLPFSELIAESKKINDLLNKYRRGISEKNSGYLKKLTGLILKVGFCSACYMVATYALILAFDVPHITSTILADVPLAIQFGYLLFVIFEGRVYSESFCQVSFIAVCTSMLMTKQVGIAMLIVVIFAYALTGLMEYKHLWKKIAVMTVLSGVIPYGINLLWKQYVKELRVSDIRSTAGASGQFDLINIDVATYFDVVSGKLEGLQSETFRNVCKAFFLRKITGVVYWPVTFATGTILILILIWLLYRMYKGSFGMKKAIAFSLTWIIGTFGYIFMLSVMFVFCFTTGEMEELRGYERYVDSFFVGGVLCVFLLFCLRFIEEMKGEIAIIKYATVCMIWTLLVAGNCVIYYAPSFLRKDYYSYYRECANDIKEKAVPDSTVTIISDEDWYAETIMYYNINEYNLLWGRKIYRSKFDSEKSINTVKEQLEQSDYIYVMATNEKVNKYFSGISGEAALTPRGLYRVMHGDSIKIEKIN